MYRSRYSGFTAKHFHQHLLRDHQFAWGYTWTKLFLQSNGLLVRAKTRGAHPLDEALLLALPATLAGAETFTDIARFGERKLVLRRRFRPFKDGTPPLDRIGDIFATLDAEQFQCCFVAWVASVTGVAEGVIAIDGKTVRRWVSR